MSHGLRIAIIGGGAAGLFAAITAKERHPEAEVTIYEKGSRLLAKVAVTGGGRCNLTNSFEGIADLCHAYPRGHQLMRRLLCEFSHVDAYNWFEGHGVPLVTQADHCVFPQSQDAMSIVGCLTSTARRLGVRVCLRHTLRLVEMQADGVLLLTMSVGPERSHVIQIEADRVAITTGGSPRAEGLHFLSPVVEQVELPVASLFTLNIADRHLLQLMGTVVPESIVSIPSTKFKAEGPLLVTHWGVSGPAVLRLSSYAARYLHGCDYHTQIAVNWVGVSHHDAVAQHLRDQAGQYGSRLVANVRPYDLPSRLWQHLLSRAAIPPQRRWAELGKKAISRLAELITHDVYAVEGRGQYKDEFVTCGGVALGEMSQRTLESRVCPHLYFAGEVLDVDGITGGFNLQAAWTMGYVVGMHIGE